MHDLWREEEDYQAERRQDRLDEMMENNPEGSVIEYQMPQWLADKMAEVERENAEWKAEENRKRMERYNAGLCEWDGCNQKRMANNAECRMHYMRNQYRELR